MVIVNDISELVKTNPSGATPIPAAPALPSTALSEDTLDVPVYPQAERTGGYGVGGDASVVRMYRTADPTTQVVSFYAGRMEQQGWTKIEDRTMHQPITIPEGLRKLMLPEQLARMPTDMQVTDLEFQRPRERCQIVVSASPSTDNDPARTLIAVQLMQVPTWLGGAGYGR